MVPMSTRMDAWRSNPTRLVAWVALLLLVILLIAPAFHAVCAEAHDHDQGECGLCELFVAGGQMLVPEALVRLGNLDASGRCHLEAASHCGDRLPLLLPAARAPPAISW